MPAQQDTSTLSQYSGVASPGLIDKHVVATDFIAGASITRGQWVSLDVAQSTSTKIINYVVPAGATPVATGDALAIGVSQSTVSAGAVCSVLIEGYCDFALTDDTSVTAAGLALVAGKTVVGQADAIEATDLAPSVGTSLAASASGVGQVWVKRKF